MSYTVILPIDVLHRLNERAQAGGHFHADGAPNPGALLDLAMERIGVAHGRDPVPADAELIAASPVDPDLACLARVMLRMAAGQEQIPRPLAWRVCYAPPAPPLAGGALHISPVGRQSCL
jgi:hypothetical protein